MKKFKVGQVRWQGLGPPTRSIRGERNAPSKLYLPTGIERFEVLSRMGGKFDVETSVLTCFEWPQTHN